MDNKILLEHLRKLPEVKLNEISHGLINAECNTRTSTDDRGLPVLGGFPKQHAKLT